MKSIEIIQIVLFFGLRIVLMPPVGRFMYKVYSGQKTWLHPFLSPIERLVYQLVRRAADRFNKFLTLPGTVLMKLSITAKLT